MLDLVPSFLPDLVPSWVVVVVSIGALLFFVFFFVFFFVLFFFLFFFFSLFFFSLFSFSDPISGPVAPLLLSQFVLHSACSLSAVVFSQTVRVMYIHLTFNTSAQSPF